MSEQEMAALGVVAATVVLFIRASIRRRRHPAWSRPSGCGCSSGSLGTPQTTVLTGRKGERPRVIVRSSEGKLAGKAGMQ